MPYASNADLLRHSCAPYSMAFVLCGAGNLRRERMRVNSNDDGHWVDRRVSRKKHRVFACGDKKYGCSVLNGQCGARHGQHGVLHDTLDRAERGLLGRYLWHCHPHDAHVASLWFRSHGRPHPAPGCASVKSVYCRGGCPWLVSSCGFPRRAVAILRLLLGRPLSNRCYGCRVEEKTAGILGTRNQATDVVSVGLWGQPGTVRQRQCDRHRSKSVLCQGDTCVPQMLRHSAHTGVQPQRFGTQQNKTVVGL